MDINWLEDFACLARTLNFTRAAEERHITQSAFSRRIRSLESWIGVPLVDRSAYPAKLSAAGTEFLPVAVSIIQQLHLARDELRGAQSGDKNLYNIAVTHSLSVTHLPPILNRLDSIHSGIRTQVMSENMHNCCELLNNHACQFLFCHRYPNVPVAIDETHFTRADIGEEMLKPYVKPNALGAGWNLDMPSESPVPYLGYPSGSFLAAVVEDLLRGKETDLDLRHADAFTEALKSFAVQGMGVAWLPESVAQDAVNNGTLVSAGGERWQVSLTLSVYSPLAHLDSIGREIWRLFTSQEDA